MQLQIVFTNTEIHIPTSALGDILIRSEARVALPVRNMQVPTEQQRAICGMVFFVGAESGIDSKGTGSLFSPHISIPVKCYKLAQSAFGTS